MKKVLVLEDESSIRSFIVINLIRAGYEVVEAETGEEALEKLSENPDVRVTLLDIMLPGIDGFEVCRRVRAAYPHIGIIMLTARSQERVFRTLTFPRADTTAVRLPSHFITRWAQICQRFSIATLSLSTSFIRISTLTIPRWAAMMM